jgi:hypothetical protein
MTDAERQNKAELERILTWQLQAKEPGPFTRVLISADGKSAVLRAAAKITVRKLSHHGKEFIRSGGPVFLGPGESFLEPE